MKGNEEPHAMTLKGFQGQRFLSNWPISSAKGWLTNWSLKSAIDEYK